jgi:hypothetical protein
MQLRDKEREMNYLYWRLPALERLKLAIKFDLVYNEMADKAIKIEFFQEVVKSVNRLNFTDTFLEYLINNYYPDKKDK